MRAGESAATEDATVKRLWCTLWGHPDSVIVWEAWSWNPEVGRYRVLREECVRCSSVLALSSLVDGEPWS